MTLNWLILETGDPERMVINPDLLGEGVKIVWGGVILNQIFDLFAQYVQKVHLDDFIHKCLHYAPGRSYLDIIGQNDIAYIISLIKNRKDMWDQDKNVRVRGTGYWQSREEIATIVHKWKWPEENSR